jgi:ABC-2 type transport system ATP-binding protein
MQIPTSAASGSPPITGDSISLEQLSRRFGRKVVLDHLNLKVGDGVCGLLGPNGAGKTTLLHTLATTLVPSSGTFQLLGLDPRHAEQLREIRRRSGYMPQHFGYYSAFTAQQFVEYVALLKEVPPARAGAAAKNALHQLDLGPIAHRPLHVLSGGQVQRVGMAQAVVNSPDLLLLDEPTAGLDPRQRLQFRRLLRQLGRQCTVLLSTHILEDISSMCDTVVVIDGGSIRFHGTPALLEHQGEHTSDIPEATPLERGYLAVTRFAVAAPSVPVE